MRRVFRLRPLGACANFRWNARKLLPHSLQAGERLPIANALGQAAVRWESLTPWRLGLLRLLGQPARTFPLGCAESRLPAKRAWAASARPHRTHFARVQDQARRKPIHKGAIILMPLLTVEPKSKPHILKVELDGNTY